MIWVENDGAVVLARVADYGNDEKPSRLRLHIRPDGANDSTELYIEVPADKFDGASADAFRAFAAAVMKWWPREQFHETVIDDAHDDHNAECEAALEQIRAGYARLVELARAARAKRGE